MRIAIPVSDAEGHIAEQFSGAATFAIYDIDDDSRGVKYLGRQTCAETGCARTAEFLHGQRVEAVMAHQISENAVGHLLEAGIVAIKDAPALSSDALIAHLVSGTLQATPPGGASGGGGCGGGSCGQCCGGGHSHAETACAEHPVVESSAKAEQV